MIPNVIVNKLAELRSGERRLRFLWGAARVFALAGCLLVLACLADWLIDRRQDTPGGLRLLLLLLQVSIGLVASWYLIVRPLLRPLGRSELARWVERADPSFDHRLITAVELNEDNARLEGMSPGLVRAVTCEAEEQSSRTDFTGALDTRRHKWSLMAAGPVLLVVAVLLLLFPETAGALLARQLLLEREVPRQVRLENRTNAVWPGGDPVHLHLRVSGPGWRKDMVGTVRIQPEGAAAEVHKLTWVRDEADGSAIFGTEIPGGVGNFQFHCWLGDGRLREPGAVSVEPRPDEVAQTAWVILPEYCGLRPGGARYEEVQPKGDVTAMADSAVRVHVLANKPLRQANLQLLRHDGNAGETVSRRIAMALSEDTRVAEATFDLRPDEHAYRVQMEDRHGFGNKHLPMRSITLLPDEPTHVMLLPERFPGEGQKDALDDTEVDGIPAVLGRPVRIAYRCRTNLALDRAQLRYRVLKPDVEASTDTPPWETLPLREWEASEEVGAFDLDRGVFEKTGFLDQIEFHPIPSPNPELGRGRLEGGGRFDFKTRDVKDLQLGDKIEYYVEVFDRKLGKPAGFSEVRVKDVVSALDLTAWLRLKRNEAERLQDLKQRQQGLFDPNQPTPTP
jgi:hypothetical protein